jgi:hypothetical protein
MMLILSAGRRGSSTDYLMVELFKAIIGFNIQGKKSI